MQYIALGISGGSLCLRPAALLRGELALRFEGRIVVIDGAIADEWGRLVARQEARGHPIAAMDGLIAATAQVHALTLVTRNATDFQVSVKAVAIAGGSRTLRTPVMQSVAKRGDPAPG